MIVIDEERDPPIVPQEYLGGVKVVDIGDLRVKRGKSRRPASACPHQHLHYDGAERRIWCPDCEKNIDAYDAFERLVSQWHRANTDHAKREAVLQEAETHTLISVAAKVIDKAWRSQTMVPACPHCREPLFPEDFKNGIMLKYGREMARAMRQKKTTA